MKLNIKRSIGAVLLTAVIASGWAIRTKTNQHWSWEQVLTTKFWILSIIHVVPAYFLIWYCKDNYETWSEGRVILIIIMVVWFVLLGIISSICHYLFGFDLL